MLTRIGAHVLDDAIEVSHAFRQFDPAGRLVDPYTTEQLTALLTDLTAATRREPTVAPA